MRSLKPFKKSLLQGIDIAEELEARGINLLNQILYETEKLERPQDKITVYLKLLQFATPPYKPVEKSKVAAEDEIYVTPENTQELWDIANKAVRDHKPDGS